MSINYRHKFNKELDYELLMIYSFLMINIKLDITSKDGER